MVGRPENRSQGSPTFSSTRGAADSKAAGAARSGGGTSDGEDEAKSESESESDSDSEYHDSGEEVVDPDSDAENDSLAGRRLPPAKVAARSERQLTEQERQLRSLLTMPTHHAYTAADLDDPDILRRGLQLLYNSRFGVEHLHQVPSVHINVSKSRRVNCPGSIGRTC